MPDKQPGGSTITGRLFRSGRREHVEAEGWRAVRAAGLTAIVDLRNADEIGPRVGDPAASDLSCVIVSNRPTEDQTHPAFESELLPMLDHPGSYAKNVELFPHLIADVFATIADARGAVLIHCSAGRDRTGLVAAVHPVWHDPFRPEPELSDRIAERRTALITWLTNMDAAALLLTIGLTPEQLNRLSRLLIVAGSS